MTAVAKVPGVHNERLLTTVRYAVIAPSSHNTQPWRFRVDDDVIELFADRGRSLPVADPDDRELTISCGAALYHLRLALGVLGFEVVTELLPEATEPDLLARLRASHGHEPTDAEGRMFRSIPERRTNRSPFEPEPLPAGLTASVMEAVKAEGGRLDIVPASARETVASLIAEGDRQQWTDRSYRRELAAWIRPARHGDGLSDSYLRGLGPVMVRTFDMGQRMAKKDSDLALRAPLLAVLSTSADGVIDWLTAGQGLARMLLVAASESVDASFLNQPVQVAALRPRLAEAVGLGDACPQLLIRLGHGPEGAPAARRAVNEVLIGTNGVARSLEGR